jgi:hypothetical protein
MEGIMPAGLPICAIAGNAVAKARAMMERCIAFSCSSGWKRRAALR